MKNLFFTLNNSYGVQTALRRYFAVLLTLGMCVGMPPQAQAQTLSATVTDISCNPAPCPTGDGAIDLTVTGGTPPYSYAWSSTNANPLDPPCESAFDNLNGVGANPVAGADNMVVENAVNAENYTINGSVLTVNQAVFNGGANIDEEIINNSQQTGSVGLRTGVDHDQIIGGAGAANMTRTFNFNPPVSNLEMLLNDLDNNDVAIVNLSNGGIPVPITPAQIVSIGSNVATVGTNQFESIVDAGLGPSLDGSVFFNFTGPIDEVEIIYYDDVAGPGVVGSEGGSYTVDFPDQCPQDLTCLSADIYTVVVTDAAGSTATASYGIQDPICDDFTVTAVVTDVSCDPAPCPMGDGGIDLTITGGTAPYLIDWELNGENLVPPCNNDIDFSSLSGINSDAIAGPVAAAVNAEPYTIQGATVTLSVPILNGGATIDENQINDSHLNGTVAVRTGVLHDGLPPGANGANVTRTWSFSDPVCNLTMFVNDIDRNDEIIINGSLNGGAAIALSPADFYYPNASPCHSYTATNTWTSDICIPPFNNLSNSNQGGMYIVFPGCIDEIEIIFYDFSSGTEGGSYSVNFPDDCPEDLTCLEDGMYEVAVTDATGTTVTAAYEVQAIVCGECTITAVLDQILCDETTGGIDITVSDCLEPYSYYWEDENGNPLPLPDPCVEEDYANFQALNGIGANPVGGPDNQVVENAINNANYTIQGATMTVNQAVFAGGGSIDEEIINDTQLNGTFALRTGIDHDGITGGYPGGAYMLRTITFDRPVCDLEMFFNDLDNNDVVIVNPKLNGTIIPITPADYTVLGTNVSDVGNNQFESINDTGLNNTNAGGIEFKFTSCVDEIELIFYDDVAGPGVVGSEGGSYSVNFPPICGYPEDQPELPEGCYVVYVTDASGAETSAEYCLEVTDVEDPQITCPADIIIDADAGSCTAVVNWTVPVPTDDCPDVAITASSNNPGDAFPIGITTVTYTATDGAGNTVTCSFTITVEDNEAPTIICPGNVTVATDAGSCEAAVTWNLPTIGDNCPGVMIAGSSNNPGDIFDLGTTLVTYIVEDAAGNVANCSFSVTIEDNENPEVTCPADITVSAMMGTCEATASWVIPTPTDNCAGVVIAGSSHDPGDTFSVGATTVTYIIQDAAGNVANCSFVVTVTDDEAPPLTCPDNITIDADAGACTAMVTWTPPTVIGGSCLGGAITLISDYDPGDTFPVGMTTVTYTATDDAGNTATCSFSITVEDNEDPVWVCPADITVSTDAGLCSADVNWTIPTVTDNCGVTSFNSNFNSGDTFPVGTTTVTYVTVDAAGNTTSCSFDVTVLDSEDPVLTCPADVMVSTDSGVCGAVVTWATPSLADNCPGASITNSTSNSGDTFPVGTTTVTYTAMDAAGNVVTCSFDVTVEDNEDPVLNCPADITVTNDAGDCGAAIAALPVPVATDNCPLVSTTSTHNPGDVFPVGTTTVTWTATDAAGNMVTCTFDVTVEDTEDPVIACPADIAVATDAGDCGAVVTWIDPVPTDNCAGVSMVCSPVSGSLFPVGTTTVTCTATDATGNTATCTFDVVVEDTEDPVITCPADITVSNDAGDCAAVVTWVDPVLGTDATDNCGVVSVVCDPVSGSTFPVGTTTVTCTATDAAGNTAICTFDVVVEDTEDPVIACPADITVATDAGDCGAIVSWTDPVPTDNCAGVSVVCSPASGDTFPVGTTTVTCTATDAAGNTAVCTFDVTVEDTEDPIITCPADLMVSTDAGDCGAVVTWADPVIGTDATDNCGVVSVTCDPVSGSSFPIGTTTVTCTATDAAGNTATCTFDVVVEDTEDPTLTCPADITVSPDPNTCSAIVTWVVPVSDNCPGATTSSTHDSGDTFDLGTTVVTYTVTDAAGNIATCSFNVTVVDDGPPTLTCPADIVIETVKGTCSVVATWMEPIVVDNCAGVTTTSDFTSGDTFPIGTTTVTYTATDAQGNTSTCTFDVTVNECTGSTPITVTETYTLIDDQDFGIGISDTESFADNGTYTFTDPGTPANAVLFNITLELYFRIDGASCESDIEVQLTDPAGNVNVFTPFATCGGAGPLYNTVINVPSGATIGSPADWVAEFRDTNDQNAGAQEYSVRFGRLIYDASVTTTSGGCAEPVIVNCPADVMAVAGLGVCGANIIVPEPMYGSDFTDCFDATISNSFTGTSNGSGFYPVGTTVVTWTATDEQGNTTTCEQTIVVEDTQNPVLTCPADVMAETTPGNCDAMATWDLPTVTDNCNATIIGSTHTSGDVFPIGTTTVTYTAMDDAGNTTSCSFDVIIGECTGASVAEETITLIDDRDTNVDTEIFANNGTYTFTDPATPANAVLSNITLQLFFRVDPGSCESDIEIQLTDPAGNVNVFTPFSSCIGAGPLFNITLPVPSGSTIGAAADWVAEFRDTNDQNAGREYSVRFGRLIYDATVTSTGGCADPIIVNCPADISLSADAGVCGAAVTIPEPMFGTDFTDCSGAIITNSFNGTSNASGFYPVGTTTVTWTAIDGLGNTTTCMQMVVITDDEDPIITCGADRVVTIDGGTCEAVVFWNEPTTSDNCGATLTSDFASGGTYPVGTTTVTYTATDAAGNTATCTFDVVVEDDEDPEITCPADILVSTDVGECGANVTIPTPSATDNCPGVTTSTTHNPGDFFAVGTTTVTWTATDVAGNTATCTFDVIVEDDQIPDITCPADITVSNDPGVCYAMVSWTPPVIDDNCGILTSNYGPGDFFPVGTTTVEYSVFDPAGNTTICSFDVIVEDTELPQVVCPADITVNNDAGACEAVVNWAVPTPIDNCGASISASSHNPGDAFPIGTTEVTYTVSDASGNEATCSFNVTVVDNEDPVITCPNDITVSANPGQCSATVSLPDPVAMDNCPGVTITSSIPPTQTTLPYGITTVTYTATDAAGNTTTCSFDVTVVDNQDPMIACPANILVDTDAGECYATVNWAVPTPTDNCGIASVTATDQPGSIFPVGTTTVTYIVTDIAGNTANCSFDIIVADNDLPMVTCPADIMASTDPGQCTATVTWVVPTPTDNCSASITVSSHDPGDVFPYGTTEVTYSVIDDSGNTATCSFNVTVEDEQDPMITCPADVTVAAAAGQCGANVTLPAATVMDNCPGITTSSDYSSGDFFPVGTTTVTWTATDIAGNTATCTFDVIVEDNEDPVISCPADVLASTDAGECYATVNWAIPTPTDNCGVASVSSSDQPGSIFPVGTTTVTYTVTDAAGNTADCSFDIIVEDNEMPMVTCPTDIITGTDPGECSAAVNWLAPTPTDNCSASVSNSSHNPEDVFPVGTTEVMYTVTDAAGNTATCSFNVTVEDTEDPMMTCPADVTVSVDPGQCGANVDLPGATVTDNCPSVTTSSDYSAGDFFPVGATTVTWTATDAAGNTTICTFDVIVEDDENPSITCPADITVAADAGECFATVIWTIPVGTDNCGVASVFGSETPGSIFPVGATTVSYTVLDDAGNTTTCNFIITVEDNEAPVAMCPADLTVSNDTGLCGANVNYAEPTPVDNCNATITASSHDPGDFFSVGTTEVTYTVTDDAGNTATCSFEITVIDNEEPTVICPADITVSANPITCDAVVTWLAVIPDDNCGSSIQGSTQSSGDVFALGTTEVEILAVDAYGNSEVCTFFVTVEDNTPPVIINCPADITIGGIPGECEGPVIVPVPVFGTDYTDCQVGTTIINDYNNSNNASDTYEVGTTVVTWTATDPSGNSVTCEQIITVEPVQLIEDRAYVTDQDVFIGILNTESFGDNDSIIIVDPGIPANATVSTVILDFFFRVEGVSCESDAEMELTDPAGNITIFPAPVNTCNQTDQIFQFLLPAASVPTEASGGGTWKLRFRDTDDQNTGPGVGPGGQPLSTEYSVRFGRLTYEVTITPDCPNGFVEDNGGGGGDDGDNSAINEIIIIDTPVVESNESTQIENSMNIYPVPTSTRLNVEYTSDAEVRADIQIIDLNGAQMLIKEEYLYEGANRFEMDVTSLLAGMYYIRVMRADGVVLVKPFTKITP